MKIIFLIEISIENHGIGSYASFFPKILATKNTHIIIIVCDDTLTQIVTQLLMVSQINSTITYLLFSITFLVLVKT